MSLEQLQNKQINLPLVGPISLTAAIVAGIAIYFLTKRKKSISLKI